MSTSRRRSVLLVAALLLVTGACTGKHDAPGDKRDTSLRFSVAEGRSDNHFIRQDGISGHLNLRAHPSPRLVMAFPAGNSGAALFFDRVAGGPVWGPVSDLKVIERTDETGRILYGMEADITVAVDKLVIDEADVGSVRFLRKAVDYAALPPRPGPVMAVTGRGVRFARERPDARSAYFVEVEILAGDLLLSGQTVRFVADAAGELKIRVAAASADPLEKPVSADRLITRSATTDRRLRQSLAFLSYESKMLAGSWRFLTYFGRDTLLFLRLTMPVLTADAAEIGLGSVFERLSDEGEVAHEEEIGEIAVYRNMAEHGKTTAAPVYDYEMVDDNLMLAPVLGAYIEQYGRDRAYRFLSGQTATGASLRSKLARNLGLVARQAQPFGDKPVVENLVAIKPGLNDGNWRDSEEGLAGGRYPYDVNAVLMPAALQAGAAIVSSGLLDDYTEALPGHGEWLRMAAVWEEKAAGYFEVSLDATRAQHSLTAYSEEHGYPQVEFSAHNPSFHAVALDARFDPVPVMHSDIGADLLFLDRAEAQLRQIVATLSGDFPAGLSTPVGVLSSNPVFADPAVQSLVTRNHYHGTVIWSWQQAMLVAGLDRQLGRDDLSEALRVHLRDARRKIWQAIKASRDVINSELWSFTVRDDGYAIAPFGQSEEHLTESNAVQLWSTVYLALDHTSSE